MAAPINLSDAGLWAFPDGRAISSANSSLVSSGFQGMGEQRMNSRLSVYGNQLADDYEPVLQWLRVSSVVWATASPASLPLDMISKGIEFASDRIRLHKPKQSFDPRALNVAIATPWPSSYLLRYSLSCSISFEIHWRRIRKSCLHS